MLDLVDSRIRLFSGLVGFLGVIVVAAVVGIRLQAPSDPVGVPWWADGKLHVGSAVVQAAEPSHLVMVRDGAVYWADPRYLHKPSDLIHVDRWGRKRHVTRQPLASPLAADPVGDTIAWVDTPPYTHRTPRNQPSLVVYDLKERRILAQRALPYRGPRWQVLDEGSFPIAVDNNQVFYAAQDGDYRWAYRTQLPPTRLGKPSTFLKDWKASVAIREFLPPSSTERLTVSAAGETTTVVSDRNNNDYGDRSVEVLSDDGKFAVARNSGKYGVRLWDVVEHTRLKPGQLRRQDASDVTFDRAGRLVVVLETQHRPGGRPLPSTGPVAPPGTTWTFRIVRCTVKPVTCEPTGVHTKNDWIVLAR